jgi:IS5 family transposase
MLHMYIAQQCLGLSDEGIEDAIYDIQSVRNFVGIGPDPWRSNSPLLPEIGVDMAERSLATSPRW